MAVNYCTNTASLLIERKEYFVVLNGTFKKVEWFVKAITFKLNPWLMDLEFNTAFTRAPMILILSQINQIPRMIPISIKSISILSSYLRLDLPKGLFPVGLPVEILKALLPSSILAFSTPHSHPSSAQIFTSGCCFKITLACIPPSHIAQLAI